MWYILCAECDKYLWLYFSLFCVTRVAVSLITVQVAFCLCVVFTLLCFSGRYHGKNYTIFCLPSCQVPEVILYLHNNHSKNLSLIKLFRMQMNTSQNTNMPTIWIIWHGGKRRVAILFLVILVQGTRLNCFNVTAIELACFAELSWFCFPEVGEKQKT